MYHIRVMNAKYFLRKIKNQSNIDLNNQKITFEIAFVIEVAFSGKRKKKKLNCF